MKKIIFVAGAMLMVSVATIVGYKAYDRLRMTDFMKANLEALTENESKGSLYGTCGNDRSRICFYRCECGIKWEKMVGHGPTTSIRGRCECGRYVDKTFAQ